MSKMSKTSKTSKNPKNPKTSTTLYTGRGIVQCLAFLNMQNTTNLSCDFYDNDSDSVLNKCLNQSF